MPYTQKLLKKMLFVKDNGFNIFAMLHLFRKRSKLNQEVPEEVVSLVCDEYIKNHDSIKKDFPYFLQVLKKQSGLYFARNLYTISSDFLVTSRFRELLVRLRTESLRTSADLDFWKQRFPKSWDQNIFMGTDIFMSVHDILGTFRIWTVTDNFEKIFRELRQIFGT